MSRSGWPTIAVNTASRSHRLIRRALLLSRRALQPSRRAPRLSSLRNPPSEKNAPGAGNLPHKPLRGLKPLRCRVSLRYQQTTECRRNQYSGKLSIFLRARRAIRKCIAACCARASGLCALSSTRPTRSAPTAHTFRFFVRNPGSSHRRLRLHRKSVRCENACTLHSSRGVVSGVVRLCSGVSGQFFFMCKVS